MNHSVELLPQSVVSTSNLDLCYPQPNSKGLGFRVNPSLEIFVRASAECRRCSCKGSFGRGSSNEVEHRDQWATPRDARNQHALKSSASNPKGPKAQNLELSKVCSFRLACGKNLKQALRRLSQDSRLKVRIPPYSRRPCRAFGEIALYCGVAKPTKFCRTLQTLEKKPDGSS